MRVYGRYGKLGAMKISVRRLGWDSPTPVEFSEWAERHDLELQVLERSTRRDLDRWYCSFRGLETLDRGILTSSSGSGDSPERAIADYAETLRGKRCVTRAMHADRQEFDAPNEWAPEDYATLLQGR